MTILALQLYTVREPLSADAPGTLAAIAEMGYTHVEPYGVDEWVDTLAEAFAAHGLAAVSAHGDPVGGDRPAIFDACRRLGIRRVIQPMSSPELWADADQIAAYADQLNEVAAEAAQAGLEFGYHNHDWEVANTVGDLTGLEYLASRLDSSVQLEVDTYWAHVGGADVPALLARLGQRVTSVHLKDGDGTKDNSQQVAVGAGTVPVLDYLDAATSIDCGIVELDDTSLDMMTQVELSYRFLTRERTWA